MERQNVKRGFGGSIDFFFNKMIPKKLLVLILAFILAIKGSMNADLWAYLAMFYMVSNPVQKLGFNLIDILKARK